MHWKKISLVGVGLLGGSLGLALKQRRLADSVIGFVRREASVAECKKLGAVDLATRDLPTAVADAELIVLCTPIAQMRPLVEQMLPALKAGAIVTDVGSVKSGVVRDLEIEQSPATGRTPLVAVTFHMPRRLVLRQGAQVAVQGTLTGTSWLNIEDSGHPNC